MKKNLIHHCLSLGLENSEFQVQDEVLLSDVDLGVVSDAIVVADTEASETVEAVVDLAAVAEGLTEVKEGLAVISTEAFSNETASFVKMAIGAHMARLDVAPTVAVPSFESMDGTSLTVTMENLDQFIVSMEAGILDGLQKVLRSIGDFFSQFYKGLGALIARAKHLKAEAGKVKGEPKKATINVAGADRIQFKGKVDAGSVVKGLEGLATGADFIFGDYTDAAKAILLELAKANKAKWWKPDVFEQVTALVEVKALMKTFSALGSRASKAPKGAFSGDATFQVKNNFFKPDLYVEKKSGNDANQTIDTPTPAEIKAIADAALTVLNRLAKGRSSNDALFRAMQTANEEAAEADKLEKRGFLSAVRRVGTGLTGINFTSFINEIRSVNTMVGPIRNFSSYAYGSLRAALQLGFTALDQYEAK